MQPGVLSFPQFRHGVLVSVSKPIGAISFTIGTVATLRSLFHGLWTRKGLGATLFETFTVFIYQVLLALPAITVIANKTRLTATACCFSHVFRSWALMTVGLKLTPNAESLRTILHVRIELILEILLGIQDQLNPFAMAIMHALREVGWMSILYTNMGYSLRHVIVRGTLNWIVLMGFSWFYYKRARFQYDRYLHNLQQRMRATPAAEPLMSGCSSSRIASTSGAEDKCNTPTFPASKEYNLKQRSKAGWDEWEPWYESNVKTAGNRLDRDNEPARTEQVVSSQAAVDTHSFDAPAVATVSLESEVDLVGVLADKPSSQKLQTLASRTDNSEQTFVHDALIINNPLYESSRQVDIGMSTIQHTRSLPEGWATGSGSTETAADLTEDADFAITQQRSRSMQDVMQLMQSTRHAAYASRYKCNMVHMKMRGIEPEQLPPTVVTELKDRLAELNPMLRITGLAIRHGCVIMSMTLTDLSEDRDTAIPHDRLAETLARALTSVMAGLPGGHSLSDGEQLTVQADEHVITYTWDANSQQYVVQNCNLAASQLTESTTDDHLQSSTSSLSNHDDVSKQSLYTQQKQSISLILTVEDVVLSVNQETLTANIKATLLLPSQHRLTGWETDYSVLVNSKNTKSKTAGPEVRMLVKVNDHYVPVSLVCVKFQESSLEGSDHLSDHEVVYVEATVTLQPKDLVLGAAGATLELWHKADSTTSASETNTAVSEARVMGVQPSEVLCSSMPLLLVPSSKPQIAAELCAFFETAGGIVPFHNIPATMQSKLLLELKNDDPKLANRIQAAFVPPEVSSNDFVSDLGQWLDFVNQTIRHKEEVCDQTSMPNRILHDQQCVSMMRDVGYSLLVYAIQQGLQETATLLAQSFQQLDVSDSEDNAAVMQPDKPQRWFADVAQHSITPQITNPDLPEPLMADGSKRVGLLHAATMSGRPEMVALVLRWGEEFGGSDWTWNWQLEDDIGCCPLHVAAQKPNCAGLLHSIETVLSDSSLAAARLSWINDKGRVGLTPVQLYVKSHASSVEGAVDQEIYASFEPFKTVATKDSGACDTAVLLPDTAASFLILNGTQDMGRASNDTDKSSAAEITCFLLPPNVVKGPKTDMSSPEKEAKTESVSLPDVSAICTPLTARGVKGETSAEKHGSHHGMMNGNGVTGGKEQGCNKETIGSVEDEPDNIQFRNKQGLRQQLRVATACWSLMLFFTLTVRVMQAMQRGHVLDDIPALILQLGGYLPMGLAAAGWTTMFGDWQAWLFPIMLMRALSGILASSELIPFPMIWQIVIHRHMEKVFLLFATVVEQVPFPLFLVGRGCEALATWQSYRYLQLQAPLLTTAAVYLICIPIAILSRRWQTQTFTTFRAAVIDGKGADK